MDAAERRRERKAVEEPIARQRRNRLVRSVVVLVVLALAAIAVVYVALAIMPGASG